MCVGTGLRVLAKGPFDLGGPREKECIGLGALIDPFLGVRAGVPNLAQLLHTLKRPPSRFTAWGSPLMLLPQNSQFKMAFLPRMSWEVIIYLLC
jgi:hypothetical protein